MEVGVATAVVTEAEVKVAGTEVERHPHNRQSHSPRRLRSHHRRLHPHQRCRHAHRCVVAVSAEPASAVATEMEVTVAVMAPFRRCQGRYLSVSQLAVPSRLTVARVAAMVATRAGAVTGVMMGDASEMVQTVAAAVVTAVVVVAAVATPVATAVVVAAVVAAATVAVAAPSQICYLAKYMAEKGRHSVQDVPLSTIS